MSLIVARKQHGNEVDFVTKCRKCGRILPVYKQYHEDGTQAKVLGVICDIDGADERGQGCGYSNELYGWGSIGHVRYRPPTIGLVGFDL